MVKDINPWTSIEINYKHLYKDFGVEKIPENIKPDYYFFRRNIAIAHRDFDKIYKAIEDKKPFYAMTGIASSGALHLGHKIIIDLMLFFKEMGGKIFYCVADIDGYTSRPKIKTLKESKDIGVKNLASVLALGLKKEDIYVQSNMPKRYYEFTFELSKKITRNTFEAIYGHIDLGKVSATLLQIADILHPQLKEFGSPMPGIVPIGLEQDPHMRITRDVAARLPYKMILPSSLYIRHMPGLKKGKKMSSSRPETGIFLTDSPEQVRKKINAAFTGGRDTEHEQRERGGRPEICKIFQMLNFTYPDDKKIKEIYISCKSGKTKCGDCKHLVEKYISNFLKKHQKKARKNEKLARKMIFGGK